MLTCFGFGLAHILLFDLQHSNRPRLRCRLQTSFSSFPWFTIFKYDIACLLYYFGGSDINTGRGFHSLDNSPPPRSQQLYQQQPNNKQTTMQTFVSFVCIVISVIEKLQWIQLLGNGHISAYERYYSFLILDQRTVVRIDFYKTYNIKLAFD